MLLVGVLWVLPMLALALLFSEGEGLVETGCRLAREHGHPRKKTIKTNEKLRKKRENNESKS